MLTTFHNDFHNTRATVRFTPGKPLSASQVRRLGRKLCGMAGCSCSDASGVRGPQDTDYTLDTVYGLDRRDLLAPAFIVF